MSKLNDPLGVRMALGDTPLGVVRRVVARGALISAVGLAGGAIVSVLATSFITSMLFRMTPLVSGRYAAVGLLLVLLGAAAALFPARRASRTDPAVVPRSE